MTRLSRFTLSLLTALALTVPSLAHAQYVTPPFFDYMQTTFRNTSAASNVVRDGNWAHYGAGQPSGGAFLDSTVFRRTVITAGATALGVLADTTAAYPMSMFPLPPTYASHGAAYGSRATKVNSGAGPGGVGGSIDSVAVDTLDTTPWIVVRVREDTTAYSWTGATGFDSSAVTIQWSPDNGATWINLGTPTRAFYASQVTGTAEDGTTPPFLIGVEANAAADLANIAFRCYPNLIGSAANTINERTACMCGGLIRFIAYVSNDASGQFALDVGHWSFTPPNR